MARTADPPGRGRPGQLRQAWELPSRQLCAQGQAQHSSRLPAEALAELACGWHCRVAKQWPPGLAPARAAVDRGREWGGPDRQPGPGFPPQAPSTKPQVGAKSRCLPRVQWVPPQPGQQARTVRFLAAGRVSGGLGPRSRQQGEDVSIQPCPFPVPENGLGHLTRSSIL